MCSRMTVSPTAGPTHAARTFDRYSKSNGRTNRRPPRTKNCGDGRGTLLGGSGSAGSGMLPCARV